MMTNNISLSNQKNSLVNLSASKSSRRVSGSSVSLDLVGWLASLKWVVQLAALYSAVMEEEITPRFTLHLLNVQAAGFFMLCSSCAGIVISALCLLWFITSISLAKRAYRK